MRKSFFLIYLAIIASSCDDHHIMSDTASFENGAWAINNPVEFDFEPVDTTSAVDMFVHLRNTDQYEFNNLYLISQIKFPHGKTVTDTLQYMMTDAEGKFLGSGTRDVYENKLWLKEGVRFRESGTYNLLLRHAMRKNGEVDGVQNLEGVLDVGYSIEKQKSEDGNK
ncbi:MAG: gliding motility lipoprotein GldH [Nonlabens sp.]